MICSNVLSISDFNCDCSLRVSPQLKRTFDKVEHYKTKLRLLSECMDEYIDDLYYESQGGDWQQNKRAAELMRLFLEDENLIPVGQKEVLYLKIKFTPERVSVQEYEITMSFLNTYKKALIRTWTVGLLNITYAI